MSKTTRIAEALKHEELPAINRSSEASGIAPFPATLQAQHLRHEGLIRFTAPAIIGGFKTACDDTHHMSYEQVSDWQLRLYKIGYGAPWFRRK